MIYKNILNSEIDEIFFIDCLSDDKSKNWKITETLVNFLASIGLNQEYIYCENKRQVIASLIQCRKIVNDLRILIQFVSHGGELRLSFNKTNEKIYWNELEPYLTAINRAMHNTLIINMSSCFGLYGIETVNVNKKNNPFFGLIAPKGKISRDEIIKGNKVLYNCMLNGANIYSSVSEMNKMIKKDAYFAFTSEGYRFIKFVTKNKME